MRNFLMGLSAAALMIPATMAVPTTSAEARDYRGKTWKGRDGRIRCKRSNGTTGLLVGAGVGALAGRAIDTRGDRTVGTLLGAVAGGVAGREIDRGPRRCR